MCQLGKIINKNLIQYQVVQKSLLHKLSSRPGLIFEALCYFTWPAWASEMNYPRGWFGRGFHLVTGNKNASWAALNLVRCIQTSAARESQIEWDEGFSVPGAFKLNHLQSIEPILFPKIFNFFTFILGGQFLLPQRASNGKGEFFQPQNWIRQVAFRAWGIQTGPFAFL